MDCLSFDLRCKLVRARLRGASVCWICGKFGVSRKCFYYHWRHFQREGWVGLRLRSHKPNMVYRTPQRTVDYVLGCRRSFNWGPNKIEVHLSQDKPEGVEPISHQTIYEILCKAGLNQPICEPRKTWGKRRFQRHKPNELWQADWKLTRDDQWMITYLDDYSRFIPGSEIFENATAPNTIKVLKQAISECGKPQQILTDQGVQFHTTQEDGITQFDKFCKRQDIQHIVASKRRPTTIGKVERFHGSYEREAHLFQTHQDYIHHWNYTRLHQGIQYLKPANLYLKQL